MLQRLRHLRAPRALLASGRQPAAPAAVATSAARAVHTAAECQRLASVADASATFWRAAGTTAVAVTASTLLAAQASAEEAPAAGPAPKPDPTSVLLGLKKLSDAKEVVLYQYATCPFCNKVPRPRLELRCACTGP